VHSISSPILVNFGWGVASPQAYMHIAPGGKKDKLAQ